MHCVYFLILDLLERYRQNTAELSPPPPCRGLVEVQDTFGVTPEKPLISEVNHLRAWVVLGWVTTWKVQVRWQILSDVSASFKLIEWCRHHHRLRLHATLKSYIWRVYNFNFFTVCRVYPQSFHSTRFFCNRRFLKRYRENTAQNLIKNLEYWVFFKIFLWKSWLVSLCSFVELFWLQWGANLMLQ